MISEYQLLRKYFHHDGLDSYVDTIHNALANKNYVFLNIEACRHQMNEIFDYLEIFTKFEESGCSRQCYKSRRHYEPVETAFEKSMRKAIYKAFGEMWR